MVPWAAPATYFISEILSALLPLLYSFTAFPEFTSRLSLVSISVIEIIGAAACVGVKAKSKKETQRSLFESTSSPLRFLVLAYTIT